MPQIIIFTEYYSSNNTKDFIIPAKNSGAYNIISHLQRHGYTGQVVDNFFTLAKHNPKLFFKYVLSLIDSDTFLVGFSCTFLPPLSDPENLEICQNIIKLAKAKNSNIKTAAGGGSNISLNFFNNLKLDYLIEGLAEVAVLKLCDSIVNKKEITNRLSINNDAFNFHETKPVIPTNSVILDGEVLPIEISRGCRFKCKFCSYPLTGRKVEDKYIRNQYSITKELEHNYNNFKTLDYNITCDTFNESTEKLERVYNAIKDLGLKINFFAYLRMDLLHAHREQIDLLKEMGLKTCFFGIETLNDAAGKSVGKGLGRERILETLDILDEKWPDVFKHGSFIFGLPHETVETINENAEAIMKLKLQSIKLSALGILPGRYFQSEFEKDVEKYGYTMLTDKWGGNNYNMWKNENLDHATARQLEKYWQSKMNEKFKMNVVNALNFRNYKMSYEEIFEIPANAFKNEEFRNRMTIHRENFLTQVEQKIQERL